ncbi:OLC1v1018170C2 [Oldenlandia corymbosa var. corymbosa]|uniref:OLC1v1018170C2 n=1 Tax=Oldenlandia corymbosa var. corymbosa TaxID=529605 RepID=A0AAV1EB07_OLDCO|nr:OLC1v1018170C2 [Oldenlandia corymbosa var. corymbosa]
MGRSSGTTSCLKLIACGGGDESVDRDDLEAVSETKGSSDRSRWSFRKRSARHRVLNNSVTSEAPSGNKASSDSAIGGFPTQGSSTTPEKNSVVQWSDEKPQLQIPVESKLPEKTETVVAEDDKKADDRVDEESIIIIQAAIRRFLAQRNFVKHKNVIKLQAAVRGHIVRRHAVGSLRCVQAIVKMQHLVRERRARLLFDESSTKEEGKETTVPKPGTTSTSTQKLLSNAFARQLLESTPKAKAITIKCDPSKPDSAWRWLERWMSDSPTESGQSHELERTVKQQSKDNIEEADNCLDAVISSPENSQSRDEVFVDALPVPLESVENVITFEVDEYKIQEPQHSVVTCDDQFDTHSISEAKSRVEDLSTGHAKELDTEPESFNVLLEMDNKQNISTLATHDTEELETDDKQNIPSVETTETEESEMNGNNSSTGSRKASNPAFVAAQTKFEELSSVANLSNSKSVGSSNVEISVDSSLDTELPVNNNTSRESELDHAESSLSHNFAGQVNGSECGTELSISSTLDSPDRSEAGVVESVLEAKSMDEVADNLKNDINSNVQEKMEEKIESTILEGDSSNSNSIVQEMDDSTVVANGEHVDSSYSDSIVHEVDDSNVVAKRKLTNVDGDSSEAEQKPVTTSTTTEVHMEEEIETSHPVRRLSPEASPISRVTVADSEGTPSSQVSIKSKKKKSAKNGSIRKSLSNGKESRLDTDHDHGARNSSEHKNGKRRNSFGSTKTDQSDNQEPRDSSSSNSLPSYMQATESARAKALPNNSPRSSPDMQDKDLLIRKRHSLPGASTRQGSPRVIRAQQQGAKGSETQSPQGKTE